MFSQKTKENDAFNLGPCLTKWNVDYLKEVVKSKPVKIVKLELSVDEVNIILDSISKQPFRDVYKLIEKIHLQSKASAGK